MAYNKYFIIYFFLQTLNGIILNHSNQSFKQNFTIFLIQIFLQLVAGLDRVVFLGSHFDVSNFWSCLGVQLSHLSLFPPHLTKGFWVDNEFRLIFQSWK